MASVGKNGEVKTVYNVGKINEAQSPDGSKTNQQKADRGASASSGYYYTTDTTESQDKWLWK